jgi:hypothetical protein
MTKKRPPARKLSVAAAVVVAFCVGASAWTFVQAKRAPVEAKPPPTPAPAAWVWWEAETPRATNFPDTNPFAAKDAKGAAVLSGGKWISAVAPDKPLFLEYDVTVGQATSYELFVRKFWLHGPFRWRFDDQPWRECGRDVAMLDSIEIMQFVSASWIRLGEVKLGSGHHVFRMELLEPKGVAAYDCFLLTTVPFVPRGKLKPDEKVGTAPAGWFPFEPDADPFSASPLDLRWMNEAHAGDGGFIGVAGDHFIHGKTGQPVRFWAIDVSADVVLNYDRKTQERLARFLAKFGVNMVRLHGPLWKEGDLGRVDAHKLDGIHALTAALKNQGIYLELSTYYPLWLNPPGGPGFEGYDSHQHPFGLSFFSQSLQRLQKGWWRTVLTSPNPYTGVPLQQDPTLAFLEVVNEDSLFFWTFTPYENVPAPQMEVLEKLFGQWLLKKDQSLAQTFSRWGGNAIRGDDAAAGRAGFMPLSDIANRRDARARDTARFLAEVQRGYYDEMFRYMKRDLSFKGCVTGSNWMTADARRLGPLDKWSNAGGDFMDRHGYYGGPHEGPQSTFALTAGDSYNDALALRFETGKPGGTSFDLPIMDLAYDGKPSVISEINWPPPNRYRTDMPLLAAAYGALQGSDAFFFFAGGEPVWSSKLEKFSITDPAAMSQFPAAALVYRQGLVKTADAVVHVEVTLPSLFELEGVPIEAPQNLDQLRAQGAMPPARFGGSGAAKRIDPLAFLTGRVEVNVTPGAAGAPRMKELSPLINRAAKTVRSATGELLWSWGAGLATIDAPAAQGATGLLAQAGAVALRDITIASGNEYGAVMLVSLDGKPLASSAKMLLQVMTEDNNNGWSAPGQGMRKVVDIGGPPLVVRNLSGRVTFKRGDASSLKVSPLDFNGYRSGAASLGATGTLELKPRTLYYVIEK